MEITYQQLAWPCWIILHAVSQELSQQEQLQTSWVLAQLSSRTLGQACCLHMWEQCTHWRRAGLGLAFPRSWLNWCVLCIFQVAVHIKSTIVRVNVVGGGHGMWWKHQKKILRLLNHLTLHCWATARSTEIHSAKVPHTQKFAVQTSSGPVLHTTSRQEPRTEPSCGPKNQNHVEPEPWVRFASSRFEPRFRTKLQQP